MTLTQEFEQQWMTLTNALVSEVIRSANAGKVVSHSSLEELFNNEKMRWTVHGQYQNAWFELLKRSDPEAAAEFKHALDSLRLMPVIPAQKPSSGIAAGPAAGGAVLGFGLSKLMALSTLMTAVGTAVIGVLGFGIGKSLYEQKLSSALAKDADSYKEQLQAAGNELAAIVRRAEQ